METYPCVVCGGTATEANGCSSCGRPHDPEALKLAKLTRMAASLTLA